jgi:hypothetical protein
MPAHFTPARGRVARMTGSIRPHRAMLLLACCSVLVATMLVAHASAAGIHFQKEGILAYERQLSKGEVHADAFHPGVGTGHLHVSLNDGRHMTVAYAASEQGKLVAQARAKGARVQVATAKPKKATAVKHKLRYIAGAILILVILIVLTVLLIGRRRTLAAQEGMPSPSEESAAP